MLKSPHNSDTSVETDSREIASDSEISQTERTSVLIAIGLTAIVFLCGLTVADPDLWGHTLYGLRSLEAGVLTETADPFSYTAPGARWVNHEWLSELIFGGLWRATGGIGLVLWRNLIVVLIAAIAALSIRRAQAGQAATVLLIALSAECLSDFVVFVRPQLATFALFALWLFVLRGYWDQRTRWIWCLPVTMVCWVNLHGGFLAGLGILGVVTLSAAIRAAVATRSGAEPFVRRILNDASVRDLAAISGLCAAATFVNPYGAEMHQMLWGHLISEQAVREWQPLWSVSGIDGEAPMWSLGRTLLSWVPFLIVVPTLIFSRRWKWIDLAILVVVGWQAMSHLRHVALLSLAVLVLLPGPLTDALKNTFAHLTERWQRREAKPVRIAGTAGVCLFLLGLQVHGAKEMWRHGIAPWEIAVECRSYVPGVPASAVAFLQDQQISGNLVTDYGWGQFVIWHCFPQNRVAFDGRYRTVYSPELEKEFFALQRAGVDRPQTTPILDRHPTDIALVPAGRSVDDYLKQRSDFRCVYRDGQAAIFVRHVSGFEHLPTVHDKAEHGRAQPIWSTFPGLINGTAVAYSAAVSLPSTPLILARPSAVSVRAARQHEISIDGVPERETDPKGVLACFEHDSTRQQARNAGQKAQFSSSTFCW
jgi:hypothetical protein